MKDNYQGFHRPVLNDEVIDFLALYHAGVYVDATIGAGGHAEALLEHTGPKAFLVGIDRDAAVLKLCTKRLSRFKERLQIIHGAFADYASIIHEAGVTKVNAVLLDLGMSSVQVNDPQRGFSFLRTGPLDMRMDQRQGMTAETIVNEYAPADLERIFLDYGEERYAKRIARFLVSERKKYRIRNTTELAELIKQAVPAACRSGRIHPATRVFQAIRMEVNQEMKQLKTALNHVAESLMEGGRMAVISFHSLEDRQVKDFIFNQSRGCVCPANFPFCVCGKKPLLKMVTKKAVRPSAREIIENPRARSARMRVAEKVA
ncbi:MAG: 16S rRNA (cytosine(1402)-N(4))-methyltransferase RsmH [Elusimicrobia bacterium]|nr:16S rRNA (cytosine(1402)-N(4))-methyltransferase RsmH [Elusimicrobiota bacterium]MBD3411599.1 16S rRNA (cytosine(1402)-N(4))-methyltransferase RsmH [Elusimicrobiota bacterium]